MSGRLLVIGALPRYATAMLQGAGVTATSITRCDDPGALVEAAACADAVLTLAPAAIDRELLGGARRLRGIADASGTLDRIDLAEASSLGVPVSSVPPPAEDLWADLGCELVDIVLRRAAHAPAAGAVTDAPVRSRSRRPILGLIGFGAVGRLIARRASEAGMLVLANDPYEGNAVAALPGVRMAALPALLAWSDVVVVSEVRTPGRARLLDAPMLARLDPSAHVVSLGAECAVDLAALAESLAGGRVSGAALVSRDRERLRAAGLAGAPRVMLAPPPLVPRGGTIERSAVLATRDAIAHLGGAASARTVNYCVYDSAAWRHRVGSAPRGGEGTRW